MLEHWYIVLLHACHLTLVSFLCWLKVYSKIPLSYATKPKIGITSYCTTQLMPYAYWVHSKYYHSIIQTYGQISIVLYYILITQAILRAIGLMVTRTFARTCKLCNMIITNEAEHKLSFCLMCEMQRKHLWHTVIDQGGTELFIKLNQSTIKDQCARFLRLSTHCVERQPRLPDITIALGRILA